VQPAHILQELQQINRKSSYVSACACQQNYGTWESQLQPSVSDKISTLGPTDSHVSEVQKAIAEPNKSKQDAKVVFPSRSPVRAVFELVGTHREKEK
jgi:hypothetical protein